MIWDNDEGASIAKFSKKKLELVNSKKAGGEGVLLKREHIEFDSDDEYQELGDKETPEEAADAPAPAPVSDIDYMRSKMKQNFEEEKEKGTEQESIQPQKRKKNSSHEGTAKKAKTSPPEAELADESPAEAKRKAFAAKGSALTPELIADTGRLFLRNLPFDVTEDELLNLCKPFGPIAETHIPVDPQSKRGVGLAFVTFMIPENAVKAMTSLDGIIFLGRLLHVLPALPQKTSEPLAAGKKQTFKEKKQQKQKENADDSVNWSSLFMRSSAVVDSLAERYSAAKGDLIGPEAENQAVRLAMMETHIINETKQVLAEEGVAIEAFAQLNDKSKRSDTVILVKNIPYTTTVEELTLLFGQYGRLGRVVLPPAKTLALVEYLEPNDAKKGFRGLSYKKFKHVPLFLEYAPVAVFVEEKPPTRPAEEEEGDPVANKEKVLTASHLQFVESSTPASRTLYIKNLNFSTTEAQLRNIFGEYGEIASLTLATRKDPATGEKMSMGFGFVEFKRRDDALAAYQKAQNMPCDGHSLELKFSKSKTKSEGKGRKALGDQKPTSKLLVRNVAFEATSKELRELFGAYGKVKSVRLPKKLDRSHRGFAFVEFLTKQEAKNALEALSATHLYGRPLKLEYAKADDRSLEAIREKTAKQLSS